MNSIINDIYNNDYATLLLDLDLNLDSTLIATFANIVRQPDVHINEIITQIGVTDTLTIFDKLAMPDAINAIIHRSQITPINITAQIINHSLTKRNILLSYANNYAVLHNNAMPEINDAVCSYIISDDGNISMDNNIKLLDNDALEIDNTKFKNFLMDLNEIFPKAVGNGLRITKLRYEKYVTDDNIKLCTSIEDLDLASGCKLTTFAPFAKSIRNLNMKENNIIRDELLKSCVSIETLYCNQINYNITTCAPFAKSLRKLYVPRYRRSAPGGITDASISMCTSIVELCADGNGYITTCAPFAATLKILSARHGCGITDEGLKLCTAIVNLQVLNESFITTCAPFAKSLRKLIAGAESITDESIKECNFIEYLYIFENKYITTYAPFAKTLRTLIVHDSSVNDDSLKPCAHIEYLTIWHNTKITTCKPFARTLRGLTVRGACGLTNDSLKICKNIEYVYSHNDSAITNFDLRKRAVAVTNTL